MSSPNQNFNCDDKRIKCLKHKLVDKKLLKQKLDQEYSTDMLGRALSKAEYLSSRFGENKTLNKQFNYYNRFDNGITKDKTNLLKSFINAIDTLQDYYEMDGKERKFPSNFQQSKIIEYVESLRNNLKKEELLAIKLFNDFIHILKGDKKINFDDYFNFKEAFVNPFVLVTSGIDAMKIAAKQEDEWKKKVEEKENYDVELKTGGNWTDNPHIPDNMKMVDKYD
jgi:hypothetical protein